MLQYPHILLNTIQEIRFSPSIKRHMSCNSRQHRCLLIVRTLLTISHHAPTSYSALLGLNVFIYPLQATSTNSANTLTVLHFSSIYNIVYQIIDFIDHNLSSIYHTILSIYDIVLLIYHLCYPPTTQFRQFHHNLLSVHISRFNHLHMYLTSFSSCYAVTCSSTTLLRPSISLIYSCFISTELFEPSLAYTFPVTFSLFYAIVFTVDRQYCYILALTLLYSQATVHCYFQRPHS